MGVASLQARYESELELWIILRRAADWRVLQTRCLDNCLNETLRKQAKASGWMHLWTLVTVSGGVSEAISLETGGYADDEKRDLRFAISTTLRSRSWRQIVVEYGCMPIHQTCTSPPPPAEPTTVASATTAPPAEPATEAPTKGWHAIPTRNSSLVLFIIITTITYWYY